MHPEPDFLDSHPCFTTLLNPFVPLFPHLKHGNLPVVVEKLKWVMISKPLEQCQTHDKCHKTFTYFIGSLAFLLKITHTYIMLSHNVSVIFLCLKVYYLWVDPMRWVSFCLPHVSLRNHLSPILRPFTWFRLG